MIRALVITLTLMASNAWAAPVRGLFIGSFDPITNAHVDVIRAGVRQLGLQEVVIVVNSASGKDYSASVSERMDLIRAAVSTELSRHVSFVIVDEPAIGKRAHAIELAASAHEGVLYQIAGDDVQSKAKELFGDLSQVRSYILPRLGEGGRAGVLQPGFNALEAVNPSGLSSTEVKERRLSRRSIRGMVPDAVLSRIQELGLYRPLSNEDLSARRRLIQAQVALLTNQLRRAGGMLASLDTSQLEKLSTESIDREISVKSNLTANRLQSDAAVEELIARRLIAANSHLSSVDAHQIRKWAVGMLGGPIGRALKTKIRGGRCEAHFAS